VPDRDDEQRPGNGEDEAALAIVARHALHDEELVAALAAGSLDGEDDADERARARGFVERCPACRALHDDIAAITGSLHAAAAFTTSAPRDFRLTVEDAGRLGGTVITRRVARGFRAMFLGFARPIGASVAALGLVGLFVGAAVVGQAGLYGAPAADTGATTVGGMQLATAAPGAIPSGSEAAINPSEPKASERTASEPDVPSARDAVAPSAGTWLLGLSALAIVVGVVMFLIGVRASRRGSAGAGDH
jgi:anti-sigma factor RsiW